MASSDATRGTIAITPSTVHGHEKSSFCEPKLSEFTSRLYDVTMPRMIPMRMSRSATKPASSRKARRTIAAEKPIARSIPISTPALAPHHHDTESRDADEQTQAEVATQQAEERPLVLQQLGDDGVEAARRTHRSG